MIFFKVMVLRSMEKAFISRKVGSRDFYSWSENLPQHEWGEETMNIC